MFLIPGFERLSWEQQVALFNYRGNLTLMSAAANRSRGNLPYATWAAANGAMFTRDPQLVQSLVDWERRMEPRSPRWSGTPRRSRSATASPIRSPHRCSARDPR